MGVRPDVIISLLVFFRFTRLFEPGMFNGRVVHHHVEDDPHPGPQSGPASLPESVEAELQLGFSTSLPGEHALLEVRAGSPPSAVEMIQRYQRIHGLDRLNGEKPDCCTRNLPLK